MWSYPKYCCLRGCGLFERRGEERRGEFRGVGMETRIFSLG